MAITGMANLAVKVADLDAAWRSTKRRARTSATGWMERRRAGADVYLGPVQITLFTPRDLRGFRGALPDEGFLHPALFTDDLDASSPATTSCGVRPWSKGGVRDADARLRRRAGRHPARVHGTAGGPGMKVTRFHHVSVNCHDPPLDDMVAFYRRVLGLADDAQARHSRRRRALARGRRLAAAPRWRPAARARESTRPATTTALRSPTSTARSPSSRNAASSTNGGCRVRVPCRSGSTIPPATPSSSSRTSCRRSRIGVGEPGC